MDDKKYATSCETVSWRHQITTHSIYYNKEIHLQMNKMLLGSTEYAQNSVNIWAPSHLKRGRESIVK